jgi:ADP-ribosylglycohydrolase
MRAGPLGLLFPGAPDEMRRAVREQSRITHLDPRCAAGAVAVAGAVALAAVPGSIDRGEFLDQLATWVALEEASVADALRGLGDWAHLPPDAAARHVHRIGLDPAHADRWMGISAFVTPSVVWSLYAFLRSPDDYWATVCTAIRVGGDTDTMAAIAGAMSGARLGVAAMPRPLVEVLNDQGTWRAEELADVARACGRLLTASNRVL